MVSIPARPRSVKSRAVRRDAIENREKILRTAAELMARRGHNVPLTEIADSAGVGVGTFYRGFPDRAALLDELQRRGYDLLLQSLARIEADGLTAGCVVCFLAGAGASEMRLIRRVVSPSLEGLIQDTRHALRRLRLAPAFTIATVLILALGIGATTSIFTLVNAVLLQSLPVANPAELYRLGREARCCYFGGYSQDKEFSLVSYELYRSLRDNTQGFSELAAFPSSQQLFGVRRSGNKRQPKRIQASSSPAITSRCLGSGLLPVACSRPRMMRLEPRRRPS